MTLIICTCIDMCGWQPCPYDMKGKPRPEGCPHDEFQDKEVVE